MLCDELPVCLAEVLPAAAEAFELTGGDHNRDGFATASQRDFDAGLRLIDDVGKMGPGLGDGIALHYYNAHHDVHADKNST